MVLRRELLLAALAVALLIAALPATALAAPQWVGAQTLDALGGHSDVTTDAQGNSAAVWTAGDGRVLAAERPFGGPWRAPQDLHPGATGSGAQIVALPSGELVAAWVAGSTVKAAERPVGGQ